MQRLIRSFMVFLTDERNLSPHTCSAYLRDITEFQQFMMKSCGETGPILNKIDSLFLRRYLAELHKRNQRLKY